MDEMSAEYLQEKYGPFTYIGFRATGPKGTRCNFCGQWCLPDIIRLESQWKRIEKATVPVYVCLMCDALEVFVGEENARDIKYAVWANPTAGLVNNLQVQAALSHGQRIEKETTLPVVDASEGDYATILTRAEQFFACGYGKGWIIIEDLLLKTRRNQKLTSRQVAVLNRYNHSCQREADKREG
jgi:hypothetical protein